MPLSAVLGRLIAGVDLTREEAHALMGVFAEGSAPVEQSAGVLVALQMKGVKPVELAGLAEVLRERALPLTSEFEHLVDTCGTGGGKTTFNLSTGAALVAAAAGAKVAKHGNRSVTSHCGSADVLEALGVKLTGKQEHLAAQLRDTGIVFLFAPNHHPSMKALGPVRRALGVRTVFNQLGPLANPAGARRQLIGVYSNDLIVPMAEALNLLGVERAFVVHSQDGLDEISPCAPTDYAEATGERVRTGVFQPSDFGFGALPQETLNCGVTVDENAKILALALSNTESHRSLALIPNASAALLLAEVVDSIEAGAKLALEVLTDGRAAKKLEQLVEASSQ